MEIFPLLYFRTDYRADSYFSLYFSLYIFNKNIYWVVRSQFYIQDHTAILKYIH